MNPKILYDTSNDAFPWVLMCWDSRLSTYRRWSRYRYRKTARAIRRDMLLEASLQLAEYLRENPSHSVAPNA